MVYMNDIARSIPNIPDTTTSILSPALPSLIESTPNTISIMMDIMVTTTSIICIGAKVSLSPPYGLE